MNEAAGLGRPSEPVTWYLARSSSLMYTAHGLLLLYLSFQVAQYLRLIRFLALVAIGHGLILMAIDLMVGMPWWWTVLEGPLLVGWGATVRWLLRENSSC